MKAESELGEVNETITVETGEFAETSFWYNPRYLLDAARVVKGEAVIYLSERGMLLVTAENFNYITAPIVNPKVKAAIETEKAAA